MNKVVVTGLGAITPSGCSLKELWSNLIAGKSAIDKIAHFDSSLFKVNIAGEVKGFDLHKGLGRFADYPNIKSLARMDRFIQLGMVAAIQAFLHSGIEGKSYNPKRSGTIMGSGIGGAAFIQNSCQKLIEPPIAKNVNRISPFLVPGAIINMLAGQVSMLFNLQACALGTVSACASSTHAISFAKDLIQSGKADFMIVGGSEASVTEMSIASFHAVRALSKACDEPKKASKPWDKARDGFVLSEGAAALTLESEAHALARGANILCELSGSGISSDAHHITAPSGDGALLSMQNALDDAHLIAKNINYINAHATSTFLGDRMEIEAIEALFESDQEAIAQTSISGTKSMTGHLLGAAGSLEAIISILAMQNQQVPPTINLMDADAPDYFDLTAKQAKNKEIKHVMSNSFGFGGSNATLIFSTY